MLQLSTYLRACVQAEQLCQNGPHTGVRDHSAGPLVMELLKHFKGILHATRAGLEAVG